MSVESVALNVGKAVIRHVAASWLAARAAEQRRGLGLVELVSLRFGGAPLLQRNRLQRKLEDIGEAVGERLRGLCEREFSGVAENERMAALDAVVDALGDADLSDTILLRADLDPIALAREVRAQVPSAVVRAGLTDDGRALFDLVLDQCCVQLVHLARELPEYDSRLVEESLRRASSVLADLDLILDRLPVTSLDAPAGTDRDEEFRRRYIDLLARHHDELELIGVSVRQFHPRTTLSVAYLSLTVNEEDRRGRRLEPLIEDRWFHREYRDVNSAMRVEAALSRSDRVLIRGEAGSGKSTLLRWLAVTAARRAFGSDLAKWNGCIPFLIKLRSYADKELPLPKQFLNEPTGPITGPAPQEWVHRQLDSGRALLLVDGVDELSDKQRPKVRHWLRALLERYPGVQVVVTSRPAAAGTRWLEGEQFSSLTLGSMSPADVRVFIERWYDALLNAQQHLDGSLPWDRAQIDEYRRGLLAQLDARAHLRSLARSPLMCAMLCALHLDRGSNLPRDRKNVYQAALEMLLDRRETEREIPAGDAVNLSYQDKRILLQDLAFWLSKNGWSEIAWDTAVHRITRKLKSMTHAPNTQVGPEEALRYLLERSGVIRKPVEGRIDFVHRTFQEFLTATEAVDENDIGLLIQNAHLDQWREIVIMTAGLLNRPQRAELLGRILDRADSSTKKVRRRMRLLAVTCRESVHDLPPEVIERLDGCAQALVPPRDARESRSLATVGEPVLEYLPGTLTELSESKASACVRTAALVNGPRALSLLAAYASDPRSRIQHALMSNWELFEPETYARNVLAGAPLNAGQLVIRRLDQLPTLRFIPAIRSTFVDLLNEQPLADLTVIGNLPKLEFLAVNCSGNVDLSPLRNYPELLALELFSDSSLSFDNLTCLRYLSRLEGLYLAGIVDDLLFLSDLDSIEFFGCGNMANVDDCTPLYDVDSLKVLMLENCKRLHSIDPVCQQENLSTLRISGSPVAGIPATIAQLQQLTTLWLDSCPNITDLGPLAELGSLKWLGLHNSRPGLDLSPLADRNLFIKLGASQEVRGLDKLGASVKIERTPF